ncbi:peptidase M75 [Rhodophyticola sp. CCM32]|uniref:imelysin family protein n=1 Tax=Rhodophyticola sp. CCM32 TaxID=2916397 RepID=UPI00107F4524|nr:imelysin family protein [Rhodophyticola sp. CCM32]QBY01487.1 peptidase M75 [Rhodophyticola sp. CCM32]
MRYLAICLALFLPLMALAQSQSEEIDDILDRHILPGFEALVEETGALAAAATADCTPASEPLRAAYNAAFDAWVRVSHLRFGPMEAENRGFALGFWPDARGATPRALADLIRDQDPVIDTPEGFATISVAARGFYGLEFLLYDPELSSAEPAAYRCALIRAASADTHATARAILSDWQGRYAGLMRGAGRNQTYQSYDEALRALFGALVEGLEFTADLRLGRPMGTFERPRPRRAEAWRSGRSLRHVQIALESQADLAARLSVSEPEARGRVTHVFDLAIARADALDDPGFAGVATPAGRLRVEALQQSIRDVDGLLRAELGPALGIAAGFNALDGD